MTHKEAIKNLTELQLRLINDNSEEAIEYNKKIHDTLAYFITQTIPLSVIEDIKAEITSKADDATKGCKISSDYYIREKLRTVAQTCDEVCKIIDRKVNEVKGDKA